MKYCSGQAGQKKTQQECNCHKCGGIVPRLWQEEPPDFLPGKYANRRWTESVAGFQYQAKKLAYCMRNNGKRYRYEATINFEVVLCPSCHRVCCSKIVRRLRQAGVEALCVRDISTNNLLHLHFTVTNLDNLAVCRRHFESAMPARNDVSCRLHVAEIERQAGWVPYVCKSADKWKEKRLLFAKGTGIQKTFVVGKFWSRPMETIWREHCETVKAVHEGLKLHGMSAVLRDAVALVGDYISLKTIRWNLGYFAETDTVTFWRESMIAQPQEQYEPVAATYKSYNKSRQNPLQNTGISRFKAGQVVRCDWLPNIRCELVGFYPHENGWTLRFKPPGETALEGIPPPIRDRLYTPPGIPSEHEFRLSGVTEDDLRPVTEPG